jgi:hypothetical protein
LKNGALPGSFRDPSGFVFTHAGEIYRCVRMEYRRHYDALMSSGLYEALTGARLLVPHDEVASPLLPDTTGGTGDVYKVLKPQRVPFISYPYEWCFGQLKDAALATLAIQKRALASGLTLKDADASNVQFVGGRAALIDTLSFEVYEPGRPWPAYRQFCQHFLAPLALLGARREGAQALLRAHLDGIPLDLAASLLPAWTKLRPGWFLHLHLHARAQRRYASSALRAEDIPRTFTRYRFEALLDSLESTIHRLAWRPPDSPWSAYETREHGYSEAALERKRCFVEAALDPLRPSTAWDLGANVGTYSRLAARRGVFTVSLDGDPACVERNYRTVVENGEDHLLPLLMDLANPSPALGWANRERLSLRERGPADLVLALALVHHLAIGRNLPLDLLAGHLRELGRHLIIEFVPKSDPQAQRLLASRRDVFPLYTREQFETAFAARFEIVRREALPGADRALYLMAGRDDAGGPPR